MAEETAKTAVPAAEEGATETKAESVNDGAAGVAPEVVAGPAEEVKDRSKIVPGMVVRVHQKIKEITPKGDERERIQIFEGTVIAKKGQDNKSATITVRKIASGVGVERIFPLLLPTLDKIEVVKKMAVRRSKLYFLRDGKKRLKEEKRK